MSPSSLTAINHQTCYNRYSNCWFNSLLHGSHIFR